MRARSLVPDTICYNMVIGALARSGERDEAERVLQLLLDDGVKPDAVTFSSLMVSAPGNGCNRQSGNGCNRHLGNGCNRHLLLT